MKVLMGLIAIGLWMNALIPVFRPQHASAQDSTRLVLEEMQGDISSIHTEVSSIQSDVSSMETASSNVASDLAKITHGTCVNDKIC